MPSFGAASETQLATCDARLQRVARRVVEAWDCRVLQGKRTEAEEAEHLADGTSHTHASKHVYPLNAPSLAMDLAPYPVDWKNSKRFYAFAGFVLGTSREMGVSLRWGGDWDGDRDLDDQTFNDLSHFEIVE